MEIAGECRNEIEAVSAINRIKQGKYLVYLALSSDALAEKLTQLAADIYNDIE